MEVALAVRPADAYVTRERELARDLLGLALAEAAARKAQRIESIEVFLGPDVSMSSDELEFAFEILTRHTLAEGASIRIAQGSASGIAIRVGYGT